jgi:hypothetical protein
MGSRFQALHGVWREARKVGQAHACANAQVQLHSCHRHESANWHQQQATKKLTGVNKMNVRLLQLGLTALATAGVIVGFDGDGYISKTCLCVSGMVLGMILTDVLTQGE